MATATADGSAMTRETRGSKPVISRRPDFNALHALPLPLRTYPLPPLFPTNPLSVVYFACTYVYQILYPPSSLPQPRYQAHISLQTRSVHVTDEITVRALWQSGFFGKGNLSRSELSWLDREKTRRGITSGETSEEITRKRREERRDFKKDRARKEREAIEKKLKEENESDKKCLIVNPDCDTGKGSVDEKSMNGATRLNDLVIQTDHIPHVDHKKPDAAVGTDLLGTISSALAPSNGSAAKIDWHINDQEHLQLSMEEAFFLNYGLGVLDIHHQDTSEVLQTDALFELFRQYSYFPPSSTSELRPDDPFLLSYVVYHHFRSLGWVVRSGVKFAVDYLLYNRGPVFSHAEFAVAILPSYRHPYWRENEDRVSECKNRESKRWWWLHCVNRVQSQVRKSLVLVYVEVPPPEPGLPLPEGGGESPFINITQLLKRYKVREVALRRWMPNRTRD
ncbi:hypothetical protein MMC19_003551 [Ptychographa xylographoides]|nr:hypothetical protein [Ptychographa xylographoides]